MSAAAVNPPIRHPMYEKGEMTRPWVQFFQSLGGGDVSGTTDDNMLNSIVMGAEVNSNAPQVLDIPLWEDIRINPGSFDRPGVSDPTIIAYDVNGGGVSTYLFQFQKTAVVSFMVQLPHGYKQGQNIYVHIHWTAGPRGTAEVGKMVGWKVDYSWANIDGAFGTMVTADLQDACAAANHIHQMTPEAVIVGTSKNMSSMLICSLKRTDTGTDDTWVGTASGELPMLLEVDFHIPLDTLGSLRRSQKW